MKRKALTVLLASIALFVVAIPVFAHHSFAAAYDSNNPITVKGVIVQVRLENPHSWFFLDVKGRRRQIGTMVLRSRHSERNDSQRIQAGRHQGRNGSDDQGLSRERPHSKDGHVE